MSVFPDTDKHDIDDLLVRGIAAAKANYKKEAQFYLNWVTRSRANGEQLKNAWLWLSRIEDDLKEKRHCLEQALANDPFDGEAIRELKLMDGSIKPSEVIDPDHLPAQKQNATPAPVQARRFVCMKCGGRMAFTPDGNALTCAYCGHKQSLVAAMESGAMVSEQDFIGTMVTVKGHSMPVSSRTLKCQGCGVSVALLPKTLSLKCPYCGSAYVADHAETLELIQPEGILPFSVTQDKAMRKTLAWMREEKFDYRADLEALTGIYIPVWTFDMGGEINWSALVEVRDNVWVPQTGSQIVYENDLPVLASHTLNLELAGALNGMPLDKTVAYDPRYLADWMAETYQVAMGDASLVARQRVIAKARPEIEGRFFRTYKDLALGTGRLVVESYKLVLVPLWITHYCFEGKRYAIVVNGQTANVRGEKPASGMDKFFKGLFG